MSLILLVGLVITLTVVIAAQRQRGARGIRIGSRACNDGGDES